MYIDPTDFGIEFNKKYTIFLVNLVVQILGFLEENIHFKFNVTSMLHSVFLEINIKVELNLCIWFDRRKSAWV